MYKPKTWSSVVVSQCKIVVVQLQLFHAVPWDVGSERLKLHFSQPTGAAPLHQLWHIFGRRRWTWASCLWGRVGAVPAPALLLQSSSTLGPTLSSPLDRARWHSPSFGLLISCAFYLKPILGISKPAIQHVLSMIAFREPCGAVFSGLW